MRSCKCPALRVISMILVSQSIAGFCAPKTFNSLADYDMQLPSKAYGMIQSANCETNARTWLALAIAGGECSLESSLVPADLLAVAQQEGVVALAAWRIRQSMQGSGCVVDADTSVQSIEAASRVDVLVSMLL